MEEKSTNFQQKIDAVSTSDVLSELQKVQFRTFVQLFSHPQLSLYSIF